MQSMNYCSFGLSLVHTCEAEVEAEVEADAEAEASTCERP